MSLLALLAAVVALAAGAAAVRRARRRDLPVPAQAVLDLYAIRASFETAWLGVQFRRDATRLRREFLDELDQLAGAQSSRRRNRP